METLFTPWRYDYVAVKDAAPGCIFCAALRDAEDPQRLVVHLTDHHLVMLNRHPYANGHLLLAPRQHVADPGEGAPEARAELWPLALLARRVLSRAYRPDGFNLGMNLGRAAGAGVPDHYHFHVVPRWRGDTNFMTVVGNLRLVPEELSATRERLRALFVEEAG
jgi:ATP adenylyltransferase